MEAAACGARRPSCGRSPSLRPALLARGPFPTVRAPRNQISKGLAQDCGLERNLDEKLTLFNGSENDRDARLLLVLYRLQR